MGWATSTLREVADFFRDQADEGADEGLPVLWQYLTKEHVAPDADPRVWRTFVKQGHFADQLNGRVCGPTILTDEEIADANRDCD